MRRPSAPAESRPRGTARFDRSRTYRYALTRQWDRALPRVCFVLLNPNTADASHDDPTIRRCIGFARRWGFGSLEVVNLFALRCRHPKDLTKASDPVGPRNGAAIARAVARAQRVVFGWGVHGELAGRGAAVARQLAASKPLCLGRTQGGHPRHPLYVRADREPVPF